MMRPPRCPSLPRPRRAFLPALGLVALPLLLGPWAGIGLGAAMSSAHTNEGPVYSVAAVRSGLTHDPGAWVSRTLLVRGVAAVTACTLPPTPVLCGPLRITLGDADSALAPTRLDLAWAGGGPLLTFLRRVPLVGAVVPRPHLIRWGAVAVYRAQLRVEPRCGGGCYEAVLLDAAP